MLSFLLKYWKYSIFIVIIVALSSMYTVVHNENTKLKEQNVKLQTQLNEAEAATANLKINLEAVKSQISNTSELLTQCYKDVDTRTKDLNEIDAIMSNTTSDTTTTNSTNNTNNTNTKIGVTKNEAITKFQNTAGLDFINRKFDALQ